MNENQPTFPPPPLAPNPPPASPSGGPPLGGDMDGNQWAMFLHLSQMAGVIMPGLGLAAPILIWQIKREKFPELEPHGKMVTNWIISVLIYSLVAGLLTIITCGVGAVLFVPLAVLAVIFPILGGLKARDGILWKYPLTIEFLR